MTEDTERKPRLRSSVLSRAFAVLAALFLVSASAASGIGIVFADSDISTETQSALSSPEALPSPVGDSGANASARGTLPEPGNPTTTESGNSSNDTTQPPRGPPSDTPTPNETTSVPDDPPVNQTSVPGPETTAPGPNRTTAPGNQPGTDTGPPENETGPPENGTEPPENRTGLPENGTESPKNRTGPPENGTESPENRTGPPENVTGPPRNGTGVPDNGTGVPRNVSNGSNIASDVPGNAAGPPENRTNRSERAGRGPNASAPTVNVTVPNATANRSVSVNVSQPEAETEETVAFSAVNVTPTRNGSFTLNVTASEAPITGKTPTRDLTNGTEPLAFLSVDHSISDRNISNVTFQFRVRKDRVNASERGEIAMYRYHDESWNELPTKLVKTTATHYVYQVRSPGLSEFAAGKQRPQFEITNATVELSTLSVGDALKVQVRITNDGDADGTFTAELVLGGESVAHRQLTIAEGGMRQTTFERRVVEPGTYEVYVNDFRVGEIVVDESAVRGDGSESPSPTGDEATDGTESTDNSTNASVPGLGVVAGVLALLATLLAVRRKL